MLSDTDKEIVHLLSEHRVITTQQFHKLLGIPERTVRYRLERLRSLGIAGRSSIYVERGRSAFHWWPTRLADSYHRGEPVPRSGERDEPNQLFLRHAAGLTGIYGAVVQLCESSGLAIHSWLREIEAKEEFAEGSRPTAIVPDVTLILGSSEVEYRAFIELDMGTMSLPRLGRKLRAYAAYGRRKAWRARHPFVPPLLFVTTSWRRAEAVLRLFEAKCRMVERDLQPSSLLNPPERAILAVCSEASTPETAFSEPVWTDPYGRDGLTVIELLHPAWERWAQAEQERRAEALRRHQHQERLAADPDARRSEIQARDLIHKYDNHLDELEDEPQKAMRILLESTSPMSRIEKAAFGFFERRVNPNGDGEPIGKPIEVSDQESEATETLRLWTLQKQQEHLGQLYGRFPESPTVISSIRRLESQLLLSAIDLRFLDSQIEGDFTVHRRQGNDRATYLTWRDSEVRQSIAQGRLIERLRTSRDQEAKAIDLERLSICTRCEQVVVTSTGGGGLGIESCPFCRNSAIRLKVAVSQGLALPDGEGFWRVCHPPMPEWIASNSPQVDSGSAEDRGEMTQ